MSRRSDTASSLHAAVAAAEPDGDGIGLKEVPADDLGLRTDGTRPTYRFRVRLGSERTAIVRCSWCTLPIVEADRLNGKPFVLDGRPHHDECSNHRSDLHVGGQAS